VKVVLDTSTLVAALLQPDHLPGQVFTTIGRSHRLVVSPAIAAEYAAVLTRPKFARLGTRKERQRAVQQLVSRPSCHIVHPRKRPRR
jgi:predicted nucleic acid-binding protein